MSRFSGSDIPVICTECGERTLRLPRKMWMRLVPLSSRRRCQRCSAEYLQVLGRMVKIARPEH